MGMVLAWGWNSVSRRTKTRKAKPDPGLYLEVVAIIFFIFYRGKSASYLHYIPHIPTIQPRGEAGDGKVMALGGFKRRARLWGFVPRLPGR